MGVWVYNEAAAQIRWDHTMILGGLIFALFSSFPANYLTNSFIIITLAFDGHGNGNDWGRLSSLFWF